MAILRLERRCSLVALENFLGLSDCFVWIGEVVYVWVYTDLVYGELYAASLLARHTGKQTGAGRLGYRDLGVGLKAAAISEATHVRDKASAFCSINALLA